MGNPLLDLFGINSDPLLGIDISSSSVKLLELNRKGQQFRVEHYGIEPLAPGAVVEKNIQDRDAVVEALEKVIKKSKVKSRLACTSVPSSAAITRIIQLSNELSEKEIGNEIELEADRYIPYALDEVNLDFEVLGPSEKHDDLVDVLLAVSKTENVEARVEVLSDAGLTAKIIDVDAFAMERAFELVSNQLPEQGHDKIVAMVDIGATMTTLNIFEDLRSIYTREQAFGGQQLTDEIQNRYGLTFEEAALARKYGDLPDDYLLEVLEPFKQTVAQQVSRSCQFFFSSGEYNEIDYMFLTGGTGSIPGLDEMIQQKLNVKCFVANPFSEMSVAQKVNTDLLMADASALMNCCGLALRNFTRR